MVLLDSSQRCIKLSKTHLKPKPWKFSFYIEHGSDPNDSNLISHDHEVLSDVFQEEFGSSLKQNGAKSGASVRVCTYSFNLLVVC